MLRHTIQMSARRPPRRRPTIRFRAGPSHQHRALAVAQTVGLHEGLRRLLEVDDRARARPVGAPEAAVESPRVEYARKRVDPSVRRMWLMFDPTKVMNRYSRVTTTRKASAFIITTAAADLAATAIACRQGARHESGPLIVYEPFRGSNRCLRQALALVLLIVLLGFGQIGIRILHELGLGCLIAKAVSLTLISGAH